MQEDYKIEAKRQIEREKSRLEVVNEDFIQDLPSPIREVLYQFKYNYQNRPWFKEAWEKYRKHVLDAGLGGKIKMPASIFNEYLDKQELERLEKLYKNTSSDSLPCCCMSSDMYVDEFLAHHGVKGQKWGIRRYQNSDGSLTEEGKVRYGVDKHGNMSKEGAKLYRKDTGKDFTDKNRSTKKTVKIAAAISAASVAGAYAVGKVLKSVKNNKVRAVGRKTVKIFGGTRDIKVLGKDGKPIKLPDGSYKTKKVDCLSLGKMFTAAVFVGAVGALVAKLAKSRRKDKAVERDENTKQYLNSIEYERQLNKKRKKENQE
jgi:hypothetical protein